MKKLSIIIICLGIITSFFITSCQTSKSITSNSFIQKRTFNKGFYLNLKKPYQKSEIENDLTENKHVEYTTANNNIADKKASLFDKNKQSANITDPIEVAAPNVISFLEDDSQSKKKNKVSNNSKGNDPVIRNAIERYKKNVVSNNLNKESKEPGTDQMLAVALWCFILLGFAGIHRMYLGYWGIGILQLLTGGCCGIWALIDLVRILTGDLKPYGSDYTETF